MKNNIKKINLRKINISKINKSYFMIFLFIFLTFYFLILGRLVSGGNIFKHYFGEAFLAATFPWFRIFSSTIISLMIFIFIFWILYNKFSKRNVSIKEIKVFEISYLFIFAYTIMMFSFQSFTTFAFMNNLVFKNSTINLTEINGVLTVSQQQLFSKEGLTVLFQYFGNSVAAFWIIFVFAFFSFAVYILLNKKIKYNDFFYKSSFSLGMAIAATSFLFLMISFFGIGCFGLNFKNMKFGENFIIQKDGQEIFEPSFLNNFLNSDFLHKGFILWGGLDKGAFWGVNDSWISLILFIIFLIIFLYLNASFIFKNFYLRDKNKIKAIKIEEFKISFFLGLFLMILFFYSFDKFLITNITSNVSNSSFWKKEINPNLFNGETNKIFLENGYKGTLYYWSMFILMNFSLVVFKTIKN